MRRAAAVCARRLLVAGSPQRAQPQAAGSASRTAACGQGPSLLQAVSSCQELLHSPDEAGVRSKAWSYPFSARHGSCEGVREMSSSSPPPREDGEQQQQHTLRWPLSEQEAEEADGDLQEMMELDIFAERLALPRNIVSMVEAVDSQQAKGMQDGSGVLHISREHLACLSLEDLQSLLLRCGEDGGGTKDLLVSRLHDFLMELQEVAVDGPVKPDWSLIDEGDEQRLFARVFTPEEVAEILVKARTEDVTILDLTSVRNARFTDHFVLATARSNRHMMAAAGAVAHELKQRCVEVIPGKAPVVEGDISSQWVCVDAGSLVVHVFLNEARSRVDLESLWVDTMGAKAMRVEQPETIHTLRTMQAED